MTLDKEESLGLCELKKRTHLKKTICKPVRKNPWGTRKMTGEQLKKIKIKSLPIISE